MIVLRRFWAVPLIGFAFAGCAEDGPVAPAAPDGGDAATYLSCEVDVGSGEIGCASPNASLGDGVLGAVIGGQGVYLQLISNNVGYDEGAEIFSANVAVRNLSNQILGSADGSTPDLTGVKVFFVDQPATEGGSGEVTVANPTGTEEFTKTDQPFFGYLQPITPGQTSLPLTWEWNVPSTVTKFSFIVGVSAEIQDETALSPGLKFLGSTLAADSQHTCALDLTGQAWCWGRASYGKLGHGEAILAELPTPQKVRQGALRFVSIAAGLHHTCAIDLEGDAHCWGNAGLGRLGDGTSDAVDVTFPIPVIGGHKFVQLAAGRRFTCGLTAGNEAYCWGANHANYSTIGDGTHENRSEPTLVAGGHEFASIAAGKYHACGITTTGDAWCWGSGAYGKLGTGSTDHVLVPTPVQGGHKFVKIDGGNAHTCALTTEGEAWCWGSGANHKLGGLTDGPEPEPVVGENPEPVRVATDRRFVEIVTGQYHTCALDTEGKAWCWGGNNRGRVGTGSTSSINVSTPQEVVGGHRFVDLVAGLEHTCGKTSLGAVHCWGRGGWGQLGNGLLEDTGTPVEVLPFGS